MDGSNGYPRPGMQPNGAARGGPPGQRPGPPGRPPGSSPPPSTSATMTRAERFEDEKRRIIDNCFSKMDTNGILSESYITHIRVQEDAAYPQAPPPPDSPPANKKPRVVIVAVRNTGRVCMHKARENSNGTFSIGKSWNLDDFTCVESFSSAVPQNEEEAHRKQWAGDTGFIVTIAKPYYWQAGTAKEKEFFIASLIKIYRKYTGGKVPEMVGFSTKEIEQMLGPPGQRGPSGDARPPPLSPAQGRVPPPRAGMAPGSSPERIQPQQKPSPRQSPALSSQPPTRSDDRLPSQQRIPSSQGQAPSGSYPSARDGNRQPSQRPSQDRDMRRTPSREQMLPTQERDIRQPPSREQMRSMAAPTASIASSQRLTPQSSRSEFAPQRSESPEVSSVSSTAPSIPPHQTPRRKLYENQAEATKQDDVAPNGLGLAVSTTDRWRPDGATTPQRRGPSPPPPARPPSPRALRPPSPKALRPDTAQSESSSVLTRSEDSADEQGRRAVPERRRPPLAEIPSGVSQRTLDGASFSREQTSLAGPRPPDAPLESSTHPSLESFRTASSNKMPGGFIFSPEPSEAKEENGMLPPPSQPDSVSTYEQAQDRGSLPNSTDSGLPVSPVENEEEHRPGLGPMFKKKATKDVANTFRKAATAYNAFKPRAGGAGDKLRLNALKTLNEPDGITGVVPAPSLIKGSKVDVAKVNTTEPINEERQKEEPVVPQAEAEELPQVTISSPISPDALPDGMSEDITSDIPKPLAPQKPTPKPAEVEEARKRKRRSHQQAKYLSALDIDSNLLNGRGLEFDAILTDFGWGSGALQPKKIESLEAEIRRETGRVEAGSWLGHLEQKDDRVEAVEKMLDRAIAECDELEGLLTLYGVELSSLNDDIAFIEAQSQGLQVQTANQKLLHAELRHLVDTISITSEQLEPLKHGSIGTAQGLESIESSLLLLYKALLTIDPALKQANLANEERTRPSGLANSELSSMRALQEKKDRYLNESTLFLERLKQFMDMTFGTATMKTKDALERQASAARPSTKPDIGAHDLARASLWQYSPLLLFAKEIDVSSWEALIKMYQSRARALYQDELRDNASNWKKLARRPTGEEQDLLFTSQEKEADGLSGTARKLTVKRSQTLARGLRSASGEKAASAEKNQSGRLHPFDAFANALEEMAPLIFTEQNFVVDFFHATSAENIDFADAISAAPPEARRGTNLYARKLFDPDRAMAKRVVEVMDDMFSFWPNDLQSLVDWAITADPLQGVGILLAIERQLTSLEETNQDFLTRTLQKIQGRLTGLFIRFVDEQIRAIEDTKVKIKKRKGVIAFIKIFPSFSAAIENMLPAADDPERSDTRTMVDEAYTKINKAMFESLKVIAKETPGIASGQTGVQGGAGADPEDKEALNYHILLIENMNHYHEEVDERGDHILSEWRAKAVEEMEEHLALYVDAVVRRPLGKLMDFIESTEILLRTTAVPTTLAARPSHSRSVFRKLLSAYDSKELRRGVDALKKRVDKHFRDADEPGLSQNLVNKVLKACEAKYVNVVERTQGINNAVYEGEAEGVWAVGDVAAAFRRGSA